MFEWVVVFSVASYAALLVCVLVWWKPRFMLPRQERFHLPAELTVVIAARNEAENLASCLKSLLAQSGLERIIVVDDHSVDSTATIIESFSNRDHRVVGLSAPALPTGWVGKSHALNFGARHVRTPYILFTDADVIFGPGILAEALHQMTTQQLDHLGGHFFVDCRAIGEEVCAPVLTLNSALALFAAAETKGAGTGAFNLVRTSVYEACAGHTRIKGELVDDVALARQLKAAGAKSGFVAMGDNLKVRLFTGFTGFVNAVARSAIPFLRWGSLAVCGAAVLCMILAFLPVLSLLGSFLVFLPAHLREPVITASFWAPVPYCIGLISVHRSRRFHNGRLLFEFCYPAAVFLLGAAVFYSALAQICGRPVMWRGRLYATN